ncbi:MAG: bifunctional riboflavin kinase/FAD synthetase [Thiobacillus sp.]
MRITHGFNPLTQPHAVTIGNFDGLHLGHQAMLTRLQQVARERKLPSCVLSFEPHPREFFSPDKAPARLSSLREKADALDLLGIDHLHVFRFERKFAALSASDFVTRVLINTLQARYVLVGDDFRFGAQRAGDIALLAQSGTADGFDAEALTTVQVEGERISSTAVRTTLAAGDLAHATRLLGRPYSICGRVMHGDKLGRKLGYPTANVELKHNRPPLSGIFAVQVSGLGTESLPGVASLGVRPTIKGAGAAPVLEVHIFDFNDEIYGHRVRVDFLHKLRDEAKYPDLPSLVAQISRDVDNAKHFMKQKAHG